MSDIVKRLRAPVTVERNDGIRIEAADEIERLRAIEAVLAADCLKLRAIRDKLLAALEDVVATFGRDRIDEELPQVRAAIVKAKEQPF